MPKYVCVLIDKNGQKIKQKIEGPSSDAVTSTLKGKGYYLVSIKEETIFDKELSFGSKGLSSKQVALFARQFSMLLRAGVPVSGALDILRDQLDNANTRKVIDATYQEVLKGLSVSAAMRATKKIPDLFVNMVEAGEMGGFLDDVMERMADYYEKGYLKGYMEYSREALVDQLAQVLMAAAWGEPLEQLYPVGITIYAGR